MNDPEPERYYDWILWKFRKEKQMEKQLELDFTSKLGEGITTTDSIIRREMYEMQKCINGLQIRVKELAEENYELKKRVIQRTIKFSPLKVYINTLGKIMTVPNILFSF